MLKSHLNAIEAVLVAQSEAASNAGHPNLRGGPREWFIREFLDGHLPSNLEIGQGEIINADSIPNPSPSDYRLQVDVVLYMRDFPKISYGGGNTAFLHEGVLATIEVKTKLTKKDLKQACRASVMHQKLKYSYPGVEGIVIDLTRPRKIASYVVAFDGPEVMATVATWLSSIQKEMEVESNLLPEMIMILGKGALWDVSSLQGLRGLKYDREIHRWAYIQQPDSNLVLLFIHMLSWMAPIPVREYAKRISLKGVIVV